MNGLLLAELLAEASVKANDCSYALGFGQVGGLIRAQHVARGQKQKIALSVDYQIHGLSPLVPPSGAVVSLPIYGWR